MSLSVLLGADAYIACSTYPDRPESGPILSISAGDLSLMISPATRGLATDDDLATAHRLAEAITAYVALPNQCRSEEVNKRMSWEFRKVKPGDNVAVEAQRDPFAAPK
ncbi:hypothetical protein [Thermomonospora sp. CIF 1]|uniref:hypothetical protein n=1 Tax=Thermomonospora sp. CIF 1 TaxID=1916083 RepID=UPI00257DD51D|nr:hypothetical protein [Thermomonospora sp. CIF 1]